MVKVVITFDVKGNKTNRKISKYLKTFALRVQESVYEADIYYSKIAEVSQDINKLINTDTDSVIIYNLGKSENSIVTALGKNNRTLVESLLSDKYVII